MVSPFSGFLVLIPFDFIITIINFFYKIYLLLQFYAFKLNRDICGKSSALSAFFVYYLGRQEENCPLLCAATRGSKGLRPRRLYGAYNWEGSESSPNCSLCLQQDCLLPPSIGQAVRAYLEPS